MNEAGSVILSIFVYTIAISLLTAPCASIISNYLQRRSGREENTHNDPQQMKLRAENSLITKRVLKHELSHQQSAYCVEIDNVPDTTSANGYDKEEIPVGGENDHDNDSVNCGNGALFSEQSECSICLEPYKVSEVVSWSKTGECDHAFHHECISPWLMRNEYCPVCRSQYLLANDMSEQSSCSQRSIFFNKILNFRRSTRTHPELQTRKEEKIETIRSRYRFCVDHGLFLPDDGSSMTTIQQTKNKPSCNLNNSTPKDADGSVEQSLCIEINEAKGVYGVFSGKNTSDVSDVNVIPL